MKMGVYSIIAIFFISSLAMIVASQYSDSYSELSITKINDKITVEEAKDCSVSYYEDSVDDYKYVNRTRDTYGTCFNPQNNSNYICINGTEEYQSWEATGKRNVLKNRTSCRPKQFNVLVNNGNSVEKKEIDFYSWGVCIQEKENDCLVIICGSQQGGSAVNGVFNGCDGGKSCQKFLFCGDSVKVLYKGSKEGFSEEDPTFELNKLGFKRWAK